MGAERKGKAGLAGDKQGKPPQRHRLAPPRGRGPSQTPKFLSPGPPSPWLPALLIGKCFCRFCGELAMPKARPCRMPDWQVEPVSPGKPPNGRVLGKFCKCRRRFNAGVPGAKPPFPPPPIKTARNPRPQSGRGRSRPARSGSSGNADYISIPMFLFSASSSEQRQQRQRSAEPQRHLRR